MHLQSYAFYCLPSLNHQMQMIQFIVREYTSFTTFLVSYPHLLKPSFSAGSVKARNNPAINQLFSLPDPKDCWILFIKTLNYNAAKPCPTSLLYYLSLKGSSLRSWKINRQTYLGSPDTIISISICRATLRAFLSALCTCCNRVFQ